jgi:hypothetical protein
MNDPYYPKYLKYKEKYLRLKRQLGGEEEGCTAGINKNKMDTILTTIMDKTNEKLSVNGVVQLSLAGDRLSSAQLMTQLKGNDLEQQMCQKTNWKYSYNQKRIDYCYESDCQRLDRVVSSSSGQSVFNVNTELDDNAAIEVLDKIVESVQEIVKAHNNPN